MIAGVQIFGIIFAIVMIYLTYVQYKRKDYGIRGTLLWMAVWIAILVIVGRPETVYGIMETLQIKRTADFMVMGGFAFFSVLIFYMYATVKKTNQKMEEIVRQIANENLEKKQKAKKKVKK